MSCVEESDLVDQPLLDAILVNLVNPKKVGAFKYFKLKFAKTENPVAYRLAQNLVNRCANRLQPSITTLLLEKPSESNLTEHIHELIFELNRISTGLLLKVFPNLEAELSV